MAQCQSDNKHVSLQYNTTSNRRDSLQKLVTSQNRNLSKPTESTPVKSKAVLCRRQTGNAKRSMEWTFFVTAGSHSASMLLSAACHHAMPVNSTTNYNTN